MKIPLPFLALFFTGLTAVSFAADKPDPKEEATKAPVVEDAKKAAKTVPPTTGGRTEKNENVISPKTEKPSASPVEVLKGVAPPATEKAAVEPAATLPQVEVKKSKITELDHELHEQDRKIAQEVKNTKSTELDGALNSPAVNPTILGGYSTKVRTGLAQERVEMMEFEKDLTEAIAHAKTKEEKAALKKQLEDIRTMRRTLESPR